MKAKPLERPRVAEILAKAPLANIAVITARGPHLTPTAFVSAAGRIWLVAARSTVKVRAIRRRPQVSVLMRDGTRSLVVSGTAEVLSPWGIGDLTALARHALPGAQALLRYTARNLPMLGGYLLDLIEWEAGTMPIDRVLVAVSPERGLVVDGDAVVERWGRWRSSADLLHAARAARVRVPVPLDGVPAEAAATLDDGSDPVLAWMAPSGPVALPARRRPDRQVDVPVEALDAVHAPARSPAALTTDRPGEVRPSRVAGVIVRGPGRVVRRGATRAVVAVEPDRVSWFAGFRAGTVTAAAPAARAAS